MLVVCMPLETVGIQRALYEAKKFADALEFIVSFKKI